MPKHPTLSFSVALLLFVPAFGQTTQQIPAARVYHHGVIFTLDPKDRTVEALAIREGRIIYVGDEKGVQPYIGPGTEAVDLHGSVLMPGIIDGHMHPLDAGMQLLKCNLDYESLTVEQFQQKVQACLDRDTAQGPEAWLEVVNWFQESMRPPGVKTTRATLDTLKTTRPILVRSSFGHTVLANTRAMDMAKITASTPDPVGGKIWHDPSGKPTGLLEDAAFNVFFTLLPKPSPSEYAAGALAALKAMNRQGVTSFLDAVGAEEDMAAFTSVYQAGTLTARAHFAPLIEPSEANAPDPALARISAFARRFDQGELKPAPGITVRNAKLFLDGVIAVPAFTGAMRQPYYANSGTAAKPDWAPGNFRGPDVYFPADPLAALLIGLARAGIDPHMHADGDAAVHAALDGIQALRKALPAADIRPAIAHDEIVDPPDFPRYRQLNAIPVLSLQWEMPAGDTVGLKDYLGPARMKILEPAGLLAKAGARIAFGSDWPVDRLDEWFAFKVGLTRTNSPGVPAELKGRLGEDPGLSRSLVLRAATINAAYELHQDDSTGSLEVGKFADFILLDRNPVKVSPEDLAHTRVLETVVGGRTVYKAAHLPGVIARKAGRPIQ